MNLVNCFNSFTSEKTSHSCHCPKQRFEQLRKNVRGFLPDIAKLLHTNCEKPLLFQVEEIESCQVLIYW